MSTTGQQNVVAKQGVEDSGKYFRYMAEFVGFTTADAETICQTRPIIEKHLPSIVSRFYTHLLRYPPTRQWFLNSAGAIDQGYLELRMRHLTNFWLRTATGVFDDEYARYIDYVGRAHTSHGADPHIYIAERYVIGQVGFVQHAISDVIVKELHPVDPDLAFRAEEAWDNLMMVLLEMLSRAYYTERTAETFESLQPVDQAAVEKLAQQAFEIELGKDEPLTFKKVTVAKETDIPEGERKIVTVDALSIGVFHHKGNWIALHNSCLHRGGPVCTGALVQDTLTCPWHGFQYNVNTGQLLVDPSAFLDSYPVMIEGGQVVLQVPDASGTAAPGATPAAQPQARPLKPNEFRLSEVPPGTVKCVELDDQAIAIFNVEGTFYATQNECPHAEGPLCEGTLEGALIECPWHGSKFDVRTGAVTMRPAKEPLKTYRVVLEGDIGRVEVG
jgi:nitrite reductase/ring-hydroxylating ferredoxin subunit